MASTPILQRGDRVTFDTREGTQERTVHGPIITGTLLYFIEGTLARPGRKAVVQYRRKGYVNEKVVAVDRLRPAQQARRTKGRTP